MHEKYPKTDLFEVVGTMDVPHPYVINQRHLLYMDNNNFEGIDDWVIQKGEQEGHVICGFPGCNISHPYHKKVLIINCKSDNNIHLYRYLMDINEMRIQDGFAGFVFKKGD